MAGKANIFSNVKVQGQRIFNTTKELLTEEKLFSKSMSEALDNIKNPTAEEFSKVHAFEKSIQDTSGLEGIKEVRKEADKLKPESMTMFNKKVGQDILDGIHNTAKDQLSINRTQGQITDIEGTYNNLIKRTKGSVMMNTPKNMISNYYGNPYKKGMKNRATGMSFKENKELQKATVRIGATSTVALTGATAIGVAASSRNKNYQY